MKTQARRTVLELEEHAPFGIERGRLVEEQPFRQVAFVERFEDVLACSRRRRDKLSQNLISLHVRTKARMIVPCVNRKR